MTKVLGNGAGFRQVVRLLLENPAIDVNSLAYPGRPRSALHTATYYGDSETVGMLLGRRDLNVNVRGSDHWGT